MLEINTDRQFVLTNNSVFICWKSVNYSDSVKLFSSRNVNSINQCPEIMHSLMVKKSLAI